MSAEYDREVQYGILKKYFEDTASDEEKNIVQSWLINSESSLKSESCFRLIWNEMDPDAHEPSIDLDELLNKIHHVNNLAGKGENNWSLPERSKAVLSFNMVIRILARIAAIFLLPLMAYVGWEIYNQKMWMTDQVEIVYNEIICPLGARSQFVLPDGTKGSLNNGSRLKYPVKFYGSTREVELVGEAFFDVSHNKEKPFIINTYGVDVRVLGTKLNVQSYPEVGFQEFTLESGIIELIKKENDEETTIARMKSGQHVTYQFENDKIKLELEKSTDESKTIRKLKNKEELDEFILKMKPGQHAKYELQEGAMDIKFVKPDHYTAWKDGKLVLRNDPIPILLKRIERWYNVKFIIVDENININEDTYWATFEEENLDQVLKLLSLTGPIKFEKRPKEQMANGTYKTQEVEVVLKE